MSGLYLHELTVRPQDIDRLGHVNNLSYLRWMVDAAVAHSAAQGWKTEDHERIGSGWVVRSHQITYLAPAFVGEPVTVRTWIAEARGASCLRRYEIVNLAPPDDVERLLARAETRWAYVRFATGAPIRIPDEVAASFPVYERDWPAK